MSLLRWPVGLAVASVVMGLGVTARTAQAADGPLLVIVEARPGLGFGAADVRQTIAAELDAPILAPQDRAAADAPDLLMVSIDRRAIYMSLRSGSDAPVSRAIPLPPDPAARLQAIGWLAGNLARDQASIFMTPLWVPVPAPPNGEPPISPPLAEAPPPLATEPPPLPPPPAASPQPPASLPPLPPVAPPLANVAARQAPAAAGHPRWAITAASGPSSGMSAASRTALYNVLNYRLEVQRRSPPEKRILGAAIETGPASQLFGLQAFAGLHHQHQRWFTEMTAGVGFEIANTPASSASAPDSVPSSTTVGSVTRPALTARLAGAVGVSVNSSVDLMFSAAAQFASINDGFLVAHFGIRYNIP